MMPKVPRAFYAVKVGRDGPNVYETWDECKTKVSRWPGAIHKKFKTPEEAAAWLLDAPAPRTKPPKDPEVIDLSELADDDAPIADAGVIDLTGLTDDDAPAADAVPSKEPRCAVKLSPEQLAVLNRVKAGKSVFFTGSAGTGKSVLLREIIAVCRYSTHGSLAITASTGIAAVNIGGTTLHSWAGIGLGQDKPRDFVGKVRAQEKFEPVRKRWRQVATLIIDEISMIDGALFDKLEEIARGLRNSSAPFGGIQLVLSGDFCQLPPVPNYTNGQQIPPLFAFEAQTWNQCVGAPVTLTRVFRQKDQEFVDMLNAMRFGTLDPATIAAFQRLARAVVYTDRIEPTELYPTRAEVERANTTRLAQLPDAPRQYIAHQRPGVDSKGDPVGHMQMERILERLVVPASIQLKVGAQVMLVKNLIQGVLVNGSVGKVMRFMRTTEARKTHTPIAGADPLDPNKHRPEDGVLYPLVQFINGNEMLCVPQEFTVDNASGGMEACREQVPLILAWALSVHKSQGQTLERVKVDLRRTFEKGQAYVALSRATRMDQLEVLNFHPSKVVAHPRVLEWHRNGGRLYSDEDNMDDEEAVAAYYDI